MWTPFTCGAGWNSVGEAIQRMITSIEIMVHARPHAAQALAPLETSGFSDPAGYVLLSKGVRELGGFSSSW
jgi:hypothetical protein